MLEKVLKKKIKDFEKGVYDVQINQKISESDAAEANEQRRILQSGSEEEERTEH